MVTLDFSGVLRAGDPAMPTAVATESGLRTRQAGELREMLAPHMADYGITRVAHLTGFDHVGLPVHMAVKPQGKTLSSGSGKGSTPDASWVSAFMECAEQSVWENLDLDPVSASEKVMRRLGVQVASGAELPMMQGALWSEDLAINWVPGWDIVAGEEVYVPESLVAVSLFGDGGLKLFVAGSNGLASGAHILEAVLSGLQEAVERDGMMLKTTVTKGKHLLADELLRQAAPSVADRIDRSKLQLEVVDATTEIGVPIVVAYLHDVDGGTTGSFKGSGAGVSSRTALVRAVTEAAQARCLIVAGARDDIFETQRSAGSRRPSVFEVPATEQLRELGDASTGSVVGDLTWMVDKLVDAGFPRVIVIRHTEPDEPVQVARVIVPGLEGYPFAHAQTGPRARAFAAASS